jgi:hypothetical protein
VNGRKGRDENEGKHTFGNREGCSDVDNLYGHRSVNKSACVKYK